MYNGTIEVEAESEEQALDIAQENIDNVNWELGEKTADFAEVALY
jgi:hypothetical protein